MKKLNYSISFFCLLFLFFTEITIAQTTNVPDDNFENYLETHDSNGNIVPLGDPNSMGNGIANDNLVFTNRINTVTSLGLHNLSISDLTGIEGFTALTNLICSSNQLTSLDLSQNTSLQQLFCGGNQLSNLNISQNTALQTVQCQNNQLTNLDITQNIALVTLQCYTNQLSSLNITQNTNLKYLDATSNSITTIDTSQNTNLELFSLYLNQLTSLDLSQNPNLTFVRCDNNQLTYLNVKNGNNTNIPNNSFWASGNPNLVCIFVDDKDWSSTNWTNIDSQSVFVETQAQCEALSVDEVNQINVGIVPNPVTNNLTIISEIPVKSWKIYSILGQKISQGNTLPIDVSELSTGNYVVSITTQNAEITNKRFVKK